MDQQTVTTTDKRGGTLWVVATPIGNLDDISARAKKVLSAVTVIAAEDTRHSRTLLAHYGIDTPLLALHEHNEREVVEGLLARLSGGDDIALVCDAGTPLISDPGYRLVRAVRQAGGRVLTVPGACAAIAALSVAGLPSDRFVFEGFLPAKSAARRTRLRALSGEPRTLIFYESSHRVADSLADMCQVFGAQREAVLARELTKLFETVIAAPLDELVMRVSNDPNQQRGEFVLLVAGCTDDTDTRLVEGRRVFDLLRSELPPAKAAKLAAAISGAPRKALYGARAEEER